jgi:hypothetical protein
MNTGRPCGRPVPHPGLTTGASETTLGEGRGAPPSLSSTLRCWALVCLRCGGYHAETLPRGRAIDA